MTSPTTSATASPQAPVSTVTLTGVRPSVACPVSTTHARAPSSASSSPSDAHTHPSAVIRPPPDGRRPPAQLPTPAPVGGALTTVGAVFTSTALNPFWYRMRYSPDATSSSTTCRDQPGGRLSSTTPFFSVEV